jgi:hypothetical protein
LALIFTIIGTASLGYFEFRQFLFKKRNPNNLDLLVLQKKFQNKNPRHYIHHLAFSIVLFAAALIIGCIFAMNLVKNFS